MAWTKRGSIKGPQGIQGSKGADGQLTDDQKITLFGSADSTRPYHGSLIWSGPWFDPPGNSFLRLRTTNNGRIIVNRNVGSVPVAFVDGDNPRLVAPVTGLYIASVVQCWGTDTGAKGAGLGTNLNTGLNGIVVWADTTTRFATVSRVVYLTAGTALYPWTFSSPAAGMSGVDRDMGSEYSLTFLQAV